MDSKQDHTKFPVATALSRLKRACHVSSGWLVLLFVSYGCASEPPLAAAASAPVTPIKVVKANRSPEPVLTEVVGTVRAANAAAIAPLVNGTVTMVRVGLGSFVRQGDVLVKLQALELDARREQAIAVSALATQERDRATALKKEGAITVAQYDAALSHWNVVHAQEIEASTVADRAILRAPFDGVITAKLVNVGETALAGRPLLTLESPAALRFEAQIPETASDELAVGQRMRVRIEGAGSTIEGRIAEINAAFDNATRGRTLKIDLPSTPSLHTGQFGRVLLTTGRAVTVTVPSNAVVRHGQLETVFVVNAGTARLRLIRCGRESDGRTQISAGLFGDETVALAGTAQLVDGQRVQETP